MIEGAEASLIILEFDVKLLEAGPRTSPLI